ncbi:MAG: hypothetical protein EOO45_14150 [Flavobacterium sp.]|nr:MAG: hypothetical protein EOO45_14150 [Flavobacterium sp.]
MDIVLKNVKKKDLPVLRSLAKSLGFEISKADDSPYDSEFVTEILKASEEVKNGKGTRVEMKNLDAFLGL